MPLPVRPLRLPRGRAADAALAAGMGALVALGTAYSLVGEHRESWVTTVGGWLLIATACGALYFARRYPVAVGVVVTAAVGVYYVTSTYDGPLFVALVVALYRIAAAGRLRAAVALGAFVVVGTTAGTMAGNDDDVNGVALFMLTGWVVAVLALGAMRHGRRAYAEGEARRRATEERLRIARELHDVIGHNISLINVQSGAALHRLKKSHGPDQAADALAAIKETSRETLRELRATLGVLRQVDEEAPTAPAPGLARLGELTGRAAGTAGLQVKTVVEGAERPLPAELDLAAYRVVQESLTNVARHARGATSVTVRLDYGERELRLEVEDDGRGAARSGAAQAGGLGGAGAVTGGGSGIGGMRERVRAVGGELAAGPRPGGAGFVVTARLPYRTEHAQA